MEIKNLFCVEYPGRIQNEQRMIDTLGGISKISNAFALNNRKLECKFRPEDKFCKGTLGEKSKTSNFLLKVTIRRTKIRKKDGTVEEKIQCIPTVVGRVKQVFKFCNLSDFQYLPIEKDENGKLISLHDSIVPKCMEPLSWLDEPVPRFLPPVCFARIDNVQPYLTSKTTDIPGTVIGRTRDRRSNYVKFVNYDCVEVPETPNPNTLRYIKLKFVNEDQILAMKDLFEKRPVWTRNALSYITKFSVVQLKYLLALSAYHFTSGPFRIAWVRFGYDPRKDPTARKYQIIDYRTRGKVLQLLEERFPNKYLPRSSIKSKLAIDEKSQPNDQETDDSAYVFKPGYMPAHRQMFYQLCDIQIPSLQQKLENMPETRYDMKSGWVTEEFCDEVRKAIDKCVLEGFTSVNDDKEATSIEGEVLNKSETRLTDEEFSSSEDEIDFEDDEDS